MKTEVHERLSWLCLLVAFQEDSADQEALLLSVL